MTIPVNKVSGIGSKTTEFLKTRHITTVEALVNNGTSALCQAGWIGKIRAERIMAEAANLLMCSGGQPSKKAVGKTGSGFDKANIKRKKRKKDKDKKKSGKGKKKDKKKNKKNKDKKRKKG